MATLTLHEPRTTRTEDGLGPRPSDMLDFRTFRDPLEEIELDDLMRHIVVCHHRYTREAIILIEGWLETLIARHLARHPELGAVQRTFSHLSRELSAAMNREERALFPDIAAMVKAQRPGVSAPIVSADAAVNAIGLAGREQAAIAQLADELRHLTHNYEIPSDACLTYRLCYEEMRRLETDLDRHQSLELDVLYPRAMELDRAMV